MSKNNNELIEGTDFIIGEVSSGTLITEDLIEAARPYMSEHHAEVCDKAIEENDIEYMGDAYYDACDDIDYRLPDGIYYGCIEGDGACIGFWRCGDEWYDDY